MMHDQGSQATLVITRAILASARPDQIAGLLADIFQTPEQG